MKIDCSVLFSLNGIRTHTIDALCHQSLIEFPKPLQQCQHFTELMRSILCETYLRLQKFSIFVIQFFDMESVEN
jgi:hypothetical protein